MPANESRRLPLLVAGALLVTLILLVWRPWEEPAVAQRQAQTVDTELVRPQRPTSPPVLGRDRPTPREEPREPPGMAELRAKAYASARSDGKAQPGDAAFRATVDAFMQYNRKFAEAQAQAEGITVAEVSELTYFGLMVMESQRWPDVEDILGQPLSAEEQQLGEELMHQANKEFKDRMRALVREQATEEQRWAFIRDVQERYKREYFALTGMSAGQFDDLLAGDVTRSGAPIATPPPPPEQVPENPDPVTEPPVRGAQPE